MLYCTHSKIEDEAKINFRGSNTVFTYSFVDELMQLFMYCGYVKNDT